MSPWLRYFAPGAIVGAVALGALVTVRDCSSTPASMPGIDAHRELAAERNEQTAAKAKVERRAARAKVDEEVRDAAGAGSLADYLRSR